MSRLGFYSDKRSAISFESHSTGLEEEQTKAWLLNLRNFIESLGYSIIDERPNREVYAKSLPLETFRHTMKKWLLIISIINGFAGCSDTGTVTFG